MGYPGARARSEILTQYIYLRFSDQFFFEFFQKKIVMEKRDRCAVFGCNNDRPFPEKFSVTSLFARKAPENTERVPP